MEASNGSLIQFATAANQTVTNDIFAQRLLKNITEENVDVGDLFRRIADDVYAESNRRQRPFSTNGLRQHQQVYLNSKYLLCQNVVFEKKFLTQHFITGHNYRYIISATIRSEP